ncbi:RNA-directed DNA polymerase, eukaryota [Tanacetum coccineum]
MVANNNSSSIENDIETVLWSVNHLSQKVTQVANQITHDFSHFSSSPPVIASVATGAFLFLAGLVRGIKLLVTVDFVIAESYGSRLFLMGFLRFRVMWLANMVFWFPEVSTQTRWIKAVPIKVNIHAWKGRMDCLPTRLNISRRGIDIPSILCPVCGSVTESSSHLFFDCLVAKDNFRKICRW